jgi:hypothetical protein
MGTLNVTTKIVAFSDQQFSNNPRLKNVDWYRDLSGVPIKEPRSESYQVQVGETKAIFNGTRSTTIDGTTTFSIALSSLCPDTYRITWTGGTNPSFRVGRNLPSNGKTLTFVVNSNATVNVNSDIGLFSAVIPGDLVFIPNITTGDIANVVSVLNSGYWQVLSVTDAQNMVLVRLPGIDFEAQNESVLLTNDNQFRAYSPTGVQVGDVVNISNGFSPSTRKAFDVVAVTDKFVEILSTTPLAAEVGVIPTSNGMSFYTDAKSFIYIETDQGIAVRCNGDTGNYNRVEPIEANEPSKIGQFLKRGPTFSLSIVNMGTTVANVLIIHGS